MDHRLFRQLAAGAAVGDLDPPERLALDAHLACCPGCRRTERELASLAMLVRLEARESAAAHGPGAALWSSIRAAVAVRHG